MGEVEIQALYERIEAVERGLGDLVRLLGALGDTLGGSATRITSGLTTSEFREPAAEVA